MKIIFDIAPHEDGVHCDETCPLAVHISTPDDDYQYGARCLFAGERYGFVGKPIVIERPCACLAAEREYKHMEELAGYGKTFLITHGKAGERGDA